jgi:CRP/FNR family transcriptional regulator, cyclic AMP receptor protein
MNLPDFVTRLPPDQKKHWEAQPIPVIEKQVIVSPDLPSADVFYVVKGEFEVTTFSEKGKIVFYRTISPGDLFGELAAIDGGQRAATVASLGDGQLIKIPGADFKHMVETSPEAGMWLVRRHTALIRSLTKKLYEQIAYDVATRILAELIRLAELTNPAGNRAHITRFPPHHVLATRLGTTREAVTRELNYLGPKEDDPPDPGPNASGGKAKKGEKKENLNLIEQTGRELTVFDLAALKRLLKERTTVP